MVIAVDLVPLCHFRCWSPLSLPQSRSVAESLRELLVYVPADNVELHNLIQLVTDRLSSTAESIRLPPWPQAAVNVSAAAEAVITIRFRRALRLIRGETHFAGTNTASHLAYKEELVFSPNACRIILVIHVCVIIGICCFGDILPKDLIRKLTLKVIIGKGLLGYLHGGVGDATGTVMRLSTIIQQMPSEWFSGCKHTKSTVLRIPCTLGRGQWANCTSSASCLLIKSTLYHNMNIFQLVVSRSLILLQTLHVYK